MQTEMPNQVVGLKGKYSHLQIAVSAFLGTVLAAAFLTSRNISTRSGDRFGWVFFILFAIAHISWIAINPFFSRLLDTCIFVAETILILWVNYELKIELPENKSWLRTTLVSLLFLFLWMWLIYIVFN